MILQLLEHLGVTDGVFGALTSLSARAGLAAVLAFVTALVTGPRLLRWLHSKRYIEQEQKGDSEQLDAIVAEKAPTPTMGGLMIVGAILAAGALCGDLRAAFVDTLRFHHFAVVDRTPPTMRQMQDMMKLLCDEKSDDGKKRKFVVRMSLVV